MVKSLTIEKPEKMLRLSALLQSRGINASPTTVWRWRWQGVNGVKLNTTMIGGRVYCRAADLDEFIDQLNHREVPAHA